MGDIATFIEGHPLTILTIFACVFLVLLVIQWFAWIFSYGRFHKELAQVANTQTLRYLVADGLVKIINDFRHLLALLIVLIFGFALAFSLIKVGSDVEKIKEILQAVTATLGGLVGSIIGYYFGESAGRRSIPNGTTGVSQPGSGTPPVPGDDQLGIDNQMRPARKPTVKRDETKPHAQEVAQKGVTDKGHSDAEDGAH